LKLKNKLRQILSKLIQVQPIDNSIVSTLYTLSEKSLLTAMVFVILITIFLYSELSYSIVLWGILLILLLLLRLYNAYLFKTAPHKHTVEIWYKKFITLALLTGMMLSVLGFGFIYYINDYYQLFILAALLGLTAGATISLSSDVRIAIMYTSIIIIPLIVSLSIIKTSLHLIVPILLILFFISQIIMIIKSHTQEQDIKELKVQKNLLNNIFSESPLAMFSYDTNLNILYANKHVYKMFGYKKNTMPGINLDSLQNANMLNVFNHALTKDPQSYTGPCVANGDHLWVKTTAFPFKSINNTIIGGVGIIEDKTKEYEDKKELESLYIKLQNQIETNQRLLDDNKLFIADMVHQIRTPLTVIMTNTSLIEMKTKEQVSSYITQINSAINMLSNSYEDLSYIISNDTIEYKAIEIDLTDFLNDRINFFEVIAHANDKTIDTNIQSNIKVYMNDTELERLVDNNLSNAIKHSDEKSEIEIVLEKNDSEIILKFISKGQEIRDVSMIFDKNYTESYGAKRSLGLGLNMVRTICEKNHIRYSAHSEDNTNTFTYIFKG